MRARSMHWRRVAAAPGAVLIVALVGASASAQTEAEAPEGASAPVAEIAIAPAPSWDPVEAEATAASLVAALQDAGAGAGDLPSGVVPPDVVAERALVEAVEEADWLVAAIGAGATREQTQASFERLSRLVYLATSLGPDALRSVFSEEDAGAAVRLFAQLRAYYRSP